MDARRAVALLLLVAATGWGPAGGTEGAREAGSWDGDQTLPEEDSGPRRLQDAEALGPLVHLLLQLKRPGRTPAFPFQPQRFGRTSRGAWSRDRLSARTGEGHGPSFWSLVAPQRFGKK